MAKIIDTRICSRCNKEYTWDYHIPNSMSDGYVDVEEVNPNNIHVKCFNPKRSNSTYNFIAICPHCHQDDSFDYENPNIIKDL